VIREGWVLCRRSNERRRDSTLGRHDWQLQLACWPAACSSFRRSALPTVFGALSLSALHPGASSRHPNRLVCAALPSRALGSSVPYGHHCLAAVNILGN
jgi:hypothetical protein